MHFNPVNHLQLCVQENLYQSQYTASPRSRNLLQHDLSAQVQKLIFDGMQFLSDIPLSGFSPGLGSGSRHHRPSLNVPVSAGKCMELQYFAWRSAIRIEEQP